MIAVRGCVYRWRIEWRYRGTNCRVYGSVFVALGSTTRLWCRVGCVVEASGRAILRTAATGICSKCVRDLRMTRILFSTQEQ